MKGVKMLYERVKQLCLSNGITITELERILKFGNGTIHKWDGVDPSIRKVALVAEHFGIGVDYLLSDMKIPSKEAQGMAVQFDDYTDEQKNLIRCYMSLIKNGKVG